MRQGIKPIHEGAAHPVGGKTDGERRSRSGGDADPSGMHGEHGRPLAASWVRMLEDTSRMGQTSLSRRGLGPVSNGAGPN
jgi:hypothetical protein